MIREDAVEFLRRTTAEILERSGECAIPAMTESTRILGNGGILSSLMLVELMLAVEDYCTANGRLFSWTDDSAMSENRSVYRTIGTLADFILSLSPEEAVSAQEKH